MQGQDDTADACPEQAPAGPRYEEDPRRGGYVLASIMEKRRARNRARNTPTQARLRAEKRAKEEQEIAALLSTMVPVELPLELREGHRRDLRALQAWLALDGPRQRQLCKHASRIWGAF